MKLQCSSVNLLGFLKPQSLGCPRIWALDSSLFLPSDVENKIAWNDLDLIGCLIRLLNVRINNRMFIRFCRQIYLIPVFPDLVFWKLCIRDKCSKYFCLLWVCYLILYWLFWFTTEKYRALLCSALHSSIYIGLGPGAGILACNSATGRLILPKD